MAILSREYFSNGKSIWLSKYQEVEDSKDIQEIEGLNSIDNILYQSSIGQTFNQTGNQFVRRCKKWLRNKSFKLNRIYSISIKFRTIF